MRGRGLFESEHTTAKVSINKQHTHTHTLRVPLSLRLPPSVTPSLYLFCSSPFLP